MTRRHRVRPVVVLMIDIVFRLKAEIAECKEYPYDSQGPETREAALSEIIRLREEVEHLKAEVDAFREVGTPVALECDYLRGTGR